MKFVDIVPGLVEGKTYQFYDGERIIIVALIPLFEDYEVLCVKYCEDGCPFEWIEYSPTKQELTSDEWQDYVVSTGLNNHNNHRLIK